MKTLLVWYILALVVAGILSAYSCKLDRRHTIQPYWRVMMVIALLFHVSVVSLLIYKTLHSTQTL